MAPAAALWIHHHFLAKAELLLGYLQLLSKWGYYCGPLMQDPDASEGRLWLEDSQWVGQDPLWTELGV